MAIKKLDKNSSDYIVSRMFWKIFPVQFFMQVIPAINCLVDNLIAGRVIGTDAVGAVALYSPLSCLLHGIAVVFSMGGVVLVVRHLGKAQKAKANSAYNLAIVLLLGTGILATLLMEFFAKPIAFILSGEANAYLADYIRGMGVLEITYYLDLLFLGCLQVAGSEKLAFLSICVMSLTNAVGDYLFVEVLELGTFGLGVSTAVSYTAQLIVLIIPFLKKSCILKFNFGKINFKETPKLIREGLPAGIMSGIVAVRALAVNCSLLAQGGVLAVSAGSIQNITTWALNSICFGVGQTVLVLMALYVSEDDRTSIHSVFKVGLFNGTVITGVVVLFVMSFGRHIAAPIYSSSPEALAYAVQALSVFPPYAFAGLWFQMLMKTQQCFGRTKYSTVFSGCESLCQAAFVVVLSLVYGVVGVWLGILVGEFAILFAALICLRIVAKKRVSFSIDGILAMPKTIGVTEGRRVERTVRVKEDAAGLEDDVYDLCMKYELGEDDARLAAKAVDEICTLMLKYSFEQTNNARADIRVMVKNKELIMRFRDNGKPIFFGDEIVFDNPDDPKANRAIKSIGKKVKSMSANSIMGMNVLTIKI